MLHKDDTYFLFSSNLTSWERNDNFYHTAPSIEGPWTKQGFFCPEGSLTYNSQSSFILPLHRGDSIVYMYMGDRWSYPHQASSATYVWLPLQINDKNVSIPEYWQLWNPKTLQPINDIGGMVITANFKSKTKGSNISIPFDGSRIAIIGKSFNNGGYARVSIRNTNNDIVHSILIDFYSKVPDYGLRYVSPILPPNKYILNIECSGEHPHWFNKRGDYFGSREDWIIIDEVRVYNK